MDTVVCKNVYVSKDDDEKEKNFNEIWQIIVNSMINN